MTTPSLTQAATIAVAANAGTPTKISQLATISIQGPPHVPADISQLAVISVIANNRGYLELGPVLKLNCWQPCTAYATPALIVHLDGGSRNV